MRSGEVWVFMFMAGVLAFSWPLPAVFREHITAYLFGAWAVFIALMFVFSRKPQNDGDGG